MEHLRGRMREAGHALGEVEARAPGPFIAISHKIIKCVSKLEDLVFILDLQLAMGSLSCKGNSRGQFQQTTNSIDEHGRILLQQTERYRFSKAWTVNQCPRRITG